MVSPSVARLERSTGNPRASPSRGGGKKDIEAISRAPPAASSATIETRKGSPGAIRSGVSVRMTTPSDALAARARSTRTRAGASAAATAPAPETSSPSVIAPPSPANAAPAASAAARVLEISDGLRIGTAPACCIQG